MDKYIALIPVELVILPLSDERVDESDESDESDDDIELPSVCELMLYKHNKYNSIHVSILLAYNGLCSLSAGYYKLERYNSIEEIINNSNLKLVMQYNANEYEENWFIQDDNNNILCELFQEPELFPLPMIHQKYIAQKYFEQYTTDVILK